MGLDNSLIIKGKTIEGKKLLDKYFSQNEDKYSPTEFEFSYWRKSWNLRERTLNTFKDKSYDGTGGEITLSILDLYDFVEKVLKYFLIEDNWYYRDSGSIWKWETMLPNLVESIHDLREFMEFVEVGGLTDDDFDIKFIDSY